MTGVNTLPEQNNHLGASTIRCMARRYGMCLGTHTTPPPFARGPFLPPLFPPAPIWLCATNPSIMSSIVGGQLAMLVADARWVLPSTLFTGSMPTCLIPFRTCSCMDSSLLQSTSRLPEFAHYLQSSAGQPCVAAVACFCWQYTLLHSWASAPGLYVRSLSRPFASDLSCRPQCVRRRASMGRCMMLRVAFGPEVFELASYARFESVSQKSAA